MFHLIRGRKSQSKMSFQRSLCNKKIYNAVIRCVEILFLWRGRQVYLLLVTLIQVCLHTIILLSALAAFYRNLTFGP